MNGGVRDEPARRGLLIPRSVRKARPWNGMLLGVGTAQISEFGLAGGAEVGNWGGGAEQSRAEESNPTASGLASARLGIHSVPSWVLGGAHKWPTGQVLSLSHRYTLVREEKIFSFGSFPSGRGPCDCGGN